MIGRTKEKTLTHCLAVMEGARVLAVGDSGFLRGHASLVNHRQVRWAEHDIALNMEIRFGLIALVRSDNGFCVKLVCA